MDIEDHNAERWLLCSMSRALRRELEEIERVLSKDVCSSRVLIFKLMLVELEFDDLKAQIFKRIISSQNYSIEA